MAIKVTLIHVFSRTTMHELTAWRQLLNEPFTACTISLGHGRRKQIITYKHYICIPVFTLYSIFTSKFEMLWTKLKKKPKWLLPWQKKWGILAFWTCLNQTCHIWMVNGWYKLPLGWWIWIWPSYLWIAAHSGTLTLVYISAANIESGFANYVQC